MSACPTPTKRAYASRDATVDHVDRQLKAAAYRLRHGQDYDRTAALNTADRWLDHRLTLMREQEDNASATDTRP